MKNFLLFIFLSLFSLYSFAAKNPAMVSCMSKGGKFLVLQNSGICVFSDNTYCGDWAFVRGKCSKGKNKLPNTLMMGKNTNQYCVDSKNKDNPQVVMCKQ